MAHGRMLHRKFASAKGRKIQLETLDRTADQRILYVQRAKELGLSIPALPFKLERFLDEKYS